VQPRNLPPAPVAPAGATSPTFLWSLSFYRDLIERLAETSTTPDIVEVGSETGEMSEVLASVAARRGGRLTVVEPFPSDRLRELEARLDNIDVVAGFSPEAMHQAPPASLYILDGDHNYSVVSGELHAVFDGRDDPIAVVHDIGWPAGRRDQYYDPERLDPEAVHPHRWDAGAVPGAEQLVAHRGFRGEGAFAFAVHEGGARNGVLTAIEDFVDSRPDLELLTTPLIFGLGVIGASASPAWGGVRAAMASYVDNPTLDAMERNRVALLLRTIELRDRYRPRDLRGALGLLAHALKSLVRVAIERSGVTRHTTT
jgi:hypothetical protein